MDVCLESIASGDGREIFEINEEGQLVHSMSSMCVTLSDGGGQMGRQVVLDECDWSTSGLPVWEMQANGQLKLPNQGNLCLVAALEDYVSVLEGSEARENDDAGDLFFFTPVPEFDPVPAAHAQSISQ